MSEVLPLEGAVYREDVEGAPFRVGQRVLVCATGESSFDERFDGQRGLVTGLAYDDGAQVPHAPMVLVLVPGLGEDVFFAAELEADVAAPRRLVARPTSHGASAEP